MFQVRKNAKLVNLNMQKHQASHLEESKQTKYIHVKHNKIVDSAVLSTYNQIYTAGSHVRGSVVVNILEPIMHQAEYQTIGT